MEIVLWILLFGAIGGAAIYLIYKAGWAMYMVTTGTKVEVVWSDPAVKVVVTLVCGLIVVLVMISYYDSHPESRHTDAAEVHREEGRHAAIQCQHFVRDKLASPSTADFPTLDFESFPRGPREYAVRSYVDSQNTYGATVRAHYFCHVRWNGQNWTSIDNWELVQLEFQ